MARSDEPTACPYGHDDTVRLLPTVAVTGISRGATAAGRAPSGGGGCCGGACGCAR
jgi:hypothetical protein